MLNCVRRGSGWFRHPSTFTQATGLSTPIPARRKANRFSAAFLGTRAGGFYPRLGYYKGYRKAGAPAPLSTPGPHGPSNPPDRANLVRSFKRSLKQTLEGAFLPTADQATARRNVTRALALAKRLHASPHMTIRLKRWLKTYRGIRGLELLLSMGVEGDDVLGVVSAILSGETRVVYVVMT